MPSAVIVATLALVGATLSAACATPDADSSTPTYARDVAPILHAQCASCHRPGEVGPFSLLSYDDARQRAARIADAVSQRAMPPWMPEPGHGEFVGARRLSDADIRVIQQWAAAGAPAGDLSAAPAPPAFPDGWQLGVPDLVLAPSEPLRTTTGEGDQFRTMFIPVALPERRFVRAVEFRSGDTRAVHHAVLRLARPGAAMGRAHQDHGEGMLVSDESIASPDGHLLGWAPGYSPTVAPPDMPWVLEPGSAIALELHLQDTGREEAVKPSVGLFFSDRAPSRTPFGLQLGAYAIDIPPGERHYVVEDRYTLPVDIEIHAVYPHAHYLGKDIRAWAILPDGSEQPLIWIKNWDFNWQNAYRYVTPPLLPRGTTIAMRYVYDNSAGNPHNPSKPPRRVRYGGHSTDEMANLWLQVVPRRASDLPLLRVDYTLRSTERQIAGYEALLAESPGDERVRRALADAHNFRGVALRQMGAPDEALRALHRAVALWPSHAPARTNLGSMLRAQGRYTDALQQYRAALESAPEFADAHFNLGLLLQQSGRVNEAAEHLRRAMLLQPHAAEPANALAWLLVTDPGSTRVRREEGLGLAMQAVELTGERDASALDTLAAAYASLGRFDRAAETAEQAWRVAGASGQPQLAEEIRSRLSLYRNGTAYTR